MVDWSKTGDRLRATWYVKKYSKPGKVKKQTFVTGPWDSPEDMPETLLESISVHRRLERGTTDHKVKTGNPAKSMREFIRSNRDEIDAGIRRALGDPDYRLNDKEREQWILNDEGLYWWARRSGVRI